MLNFEFSFPSVEMSLSDHHIWWPLTSPVKKILYGFSFFILSKTVKKTFPVQFSIRPLPRAKLCRAKFSSGEIIRRAKFWSLNEKFVTFARRKIRNLSYFMRTQYN